MMRFIQSSIRNKLILLLLFSVVVPVATSNIITYVYTKNSLKNQAIDINKKLISEGRENLLNYLDTIENSTFTLYSNATLENILNRGWTDNQSESYIMTAMQLVSRSAEGIHQVYLSVDSNNRSYLLYKDTYTKGFTNHPPILDEQITPYVAYVESTHESHNFELKPVTSADSKMVFTIHRPLYMIPSTERIGIISVDVKLDIVENLVARLFDSKKEELYILDKEGRVVYTSGDSKVGEILTEAWAQNIAMSTETLGSLELKTAEFSGITIFSKLESSMVDWTIVKRVPDVSLYANARQLGLINSWVAIIFLVIALVAIVVVSDRFTKPIKELIRWSNAIQAGKLEETISINRMDEIGSLARRFKSMMQTINDLVLRGYKLSLANKTNELKILQSQINPHFMYNSLQSIGALALEYNVPKVYMLLMSMGQIMHYSMNSKETTVPLAKEMEYVNYYLVLQKQRFEDDLHFDMHIDNDTKNITVPKMIVQPIVENYFKHGKHSSAQAGHITIHTYLNEEVLIIVVEDNGGGIPEERLNQLRHELSRIQNSAIDRAEHIGLMNVLNRLRLYHGNQAGLELNNLENGGLKVTILIPLWSNDEEESTKSST